MAVSSLEIAGATLSPAPWLNPQNKLASNRRKDYWHMPRCPDRNRKKQSINLALDDALCQDLELLAREYGRSLSSTIETVVILLKSEHEQSDAEQVARLLLKAKIRFLSGLESVFGATPQSNRHVTLDSEVLEFADMLATKCPSVFSSRKEVLVLCLRHAQQLCHTDLQRNYLIRRLHDARSSRDIKTR